MNDRVTELEVRLAFQEKMLAELNEVVTRQQREIERLVNDVRVLRQQLTVVAPSLAASPGEETPPPHY
jgi:SlyX protein